MAYVKNVCEEPITYSYAKHSHGYALCLASISCLVHFYVSRKRVLLFNAVFVLTIPLIVAINHLANRPNFILHADSVSLWRWGKELNFFSASVPSSLTRFPAPYLCHTLFSLLLLSSSSPFPYVHILKPTLFIKTLQP